jgi:hypothetical protein
MESCQKFEVDVDIDARLSLARVASFWRSSGASELAVLFLNGSRKLA